MQVHRPYKKEDGANRENAQQQLIAGAILLRAMVPLTRPPKPDLAGKPVLIVEQQGKRLTALASASRDERQLDAQGRLLLQADLRLHDALQAEIEGLQEELARRGYNDARVKLLMTLPGVDVNVAETLLAALGDASRFAEPDQAACYLGPVPRTRQSADRSYHGPITKAGNSHGRWCMVQAAHSVAPHPGPLGHFFNKLAILFHFTAKE